MIRIFNILVTFEGGIKEKQMAKVRIINASKKPKIKLTPEEIAKVFGARIMSKEEAAEYRKKFNLPDPRNPA
jgi:hypothetical protein